MGDTCCAGTNDLSPTTRGAIASVMPRGKTVRDKCPQCFQIPASNGMCGCDA